MTIAQMQCPFCGARALEEFTFRNVRREGSADSITALHECDGSTEVSFEHWQHVAGCRAWLAVRRNPSIGTTLSVGFLDAEEA